MFFQTGGTYFGELTKELHSVDLNGVDEKTHITSKYANRLIPSPDNKWIAFSHLHKVYIAPIPHTGKPLNLDNKTNSIPVSQVARDAGINLHWSADSKKIRWTLGEEYFENDIDQRFTYLPNSPDSIAAIDTTGIRVNLVQDTDKPNGKIVLRGATIITMEGDKVIKNGTHCNQRKPNSKQLEQLRKLRIPKGAKVYEMEGKTIMPGIVDVHAHIGAFRYGLTTQKHWQFYANLAYGVTTAHDPSANTETVFALSELVKSGEACWPTLIFNRLYFIWWRWRF